MRQLTSETLRGLWSAVPTPWTPDGRLDETILRRNCLRLAEARVDGVYTTDSDGEFYAIEIDEFGRLAKAFGRAMEEAKLDAAMGVSWSSTQGVIDRLKASVDAGVPNVHIAFPIFMPPARSDVDRFFEDVIRAVPDGRLIHYGHPRCGPTLSGADYARLAKTFRGHLIGTKNSPLDVMAMSELMLRSAGELAHLVVDPTMLIGTMCGAKGNCSYWVNTLPRWTRAYMDACLAGRWEEARRMHLKLMDWELTHVSKVRAAGHLHGVIGKARGALTGFLEDSGYTKPPYYPLPAAMQAELQRAFDTFWAEEIEADDLVRAARRERSGKGA